MSEALLSKVVGLEFPVDFGDGGVVVSELTMRKPKVKDVVAARRPGGSDLEVEMRLLAILCGVPPSLIEEMYHSDYDRLCRACAELEPDGATPDDVMIVRIALVAKVLHQPIDSLMAMSPAIFESVERAAAKIVEEEKG